MNETDNGSRPAFPNMPPMDVCGVGSAGGYPYPDAGMSKREYFAAMALIGMGTWMPDHCDMRPNLSGTAALKARANWAVRQADALLSALRKEG